MLLKIIYYSTIITELLGNIILLLPIYPCKSVRSALLCIPKNFLFEYNYQNIENKKVSAFWQRPFYEIFIKPIYSPCIRISPSITFDFFLNLSRKLVTEINITGTTTKVKNVATLSPKIIATPIGLQNAVF